MNNSFEYAATAPFLVVLTAGVLSVLIEAFASRSARRSLQVSLVFASLAVALFYTLRNASAAIFGTPGLYGQQTHGLRQLVARGAVAVDGVGMFLQVTILVIALLGALLFAESRVDPQGDAFTARASALPGGEDERAFTAQGWTQTEVWPLFLFAVGGMVLFPVANDLLTMFVALEVLSLPLYLIAGMARRRRLLSQEASLKYFVLGAFSSAFFLMGTALIYAVTNSLQLGVIAASLGNTSQDGLLLSGVALLAIGLLFKVGAVPFHQWTPDVYQGAPTPLTAFMAAGTKIAAFGALLRLFFVAFAGLRWDWQPLLWIIAMLTMLVGSVVAVTQTEVKRILAFSSVAHSGFILLGVIAASARGLAAVLIYLFAYGFTTLGAFAIVSLVRGPSGEVGHISQWAGLGRKSPLVAGVFALFLLAFAGIPLTSGFTAKFAVFTAAMSAGATPLVIVAVVSSSIAAFFYGRLIVLMFFTPAPESSASVVTPSWMTSAAIGICAAITVLVGVVPQSLINFAVDAGLFVR